MLSDDDKARLREQELFRKELRSELNDKPRSSFMGETGKWLVTTLIIPVSVYFWGINNQKATDNRQDVAQLTALLPGLSSTSPEQRCIAVTVLAQLVSVEGAPSSLKSTYAKIRGRAVADREAGDPAIQADAAETLGCLSLGEGLPKPPPPSQPTDASSNVPVRQPPAAATALKSNTVAYLQIYREDQRRPATLLKEQLQRAGLPVLGIENVSNTHPDTAQKYPQLHSVDVRFYNPNDRDAAVSLTPIIDRILPFRTKATVHDLSGRGVKVKSGTLEIWLPCADIQRACVDGGPPAQSY